MTVAVVVGVVALLLTAGLVARWPVLGLYIVAACIVLIEAEPLAISVLSDRLYLYHWPPDLAGHAERPIGLVLLFVLGCIVYRRVRRRQRPLEGGPLLAPLAGLLLCVAWGALHGWVAGGDVRIIVLEVRPFWYLFLAQLLAYNLVAQTRHVRCLFWVIILGAGVKSLQGLYVYVGVLHGHLEGHHAIMAHEESFFLAAAVVLFLIFFLQRRRDGQYHVLLQLLPLMATVLMANQRRAAYVALIAGAGVAWALAFVVTAPDRSRLLTVLRVTVPLVVGYVLAFHQDPSLVGRPAHAVVSLLVPDPTDTVSADSATYRAIENHDLKTTALQHPLLGWGFGRPFLDPMPLPEVSARQRYARYIPHNTIYWVWMRLGLVGFLALWVVFGAIVVRGSLIAARLRDPYLRSVAILVVAATIMEILVAYADLQLYSHRNVLYLGLLAGMLVRLPVCDADEGPSPAAARPISAA
jgi:hypothetical protein